MPGKIDHSGMTYGNWTLLSLSNMRPKKYLCRCSCGNEAEVFHSNLRKNSNSCLKCFGTQNTKNKFIGKKFHHLTIIDVMKLNGKNKAIALCDCGNQKEIEIGRINKSDQKIVPFKYSSCGKCNLNTKKNDTNPKKFLIEGKRFGMLEIIKVFNIDSALAKCDCGDEKIIRRHHLKTKIPSCGCYWKNQHIEHSKKLEGIKYFYLSIKKFLRMGGEKSRAIYLLKCKCGKEFEQSISYLFGATSCGCRKKDLYAKGLIRSSSKLKDFEVKSIRQLNELGLYSKKDLAKMFHISYEHCCSIVNKKSWKNLK